MVAGSTDPAVRTAMTRRVLRRTVTKGEMRVPAVPGMVDEFVALCDETFSALGAKFSDEELAHLREVLLGQLQEAFQASPRSDVVISYDSPYGLQVNYHAQAQWLTLDGAYNNWVATREPPLFGTEPDARVWALAAQALDPATFPVLDIGGGTGRNALPLARRGHPVDVVEMTDKFAEIIRLEAARESLNIRVIQRDVFASRPEDLRRDYQMILLSEVVSDFRGVEQLRSLFELASQCLAPGGLLVFNVFLPRTGYIPDAAARELGQQCYTTIFTYPEVAQAAALLPLDLVSDESVYDFEKANLPPENWPPTSWYEGWVSGQDVFDMPRDQSPIEMRWLVYRKGGWIVQRRSSEDSPARW
ncbi:MAG: class I SAM-dependent methyltransferase [Mycobacterium sp.]|nr:class I SAM-dependent methyltransferase [Mycobacterium sp.]